MFKQKKQQLKNHDTLTTEELVHPSDAPVRKAKHHVHELKNQCQSTSWFIVENLLVAIGRIQAFRSLWLCLFFAFYFVVSLVSLFLLVTYEVLICSLSCRSYVDDIAYTCLKCKTKKGAI